jgi:hypothetical protein
MAEFFNKWLEIAKESLPDEDPERETCELDFIKRIISDSDSSKDNHGR